MTESEGVREHIRGQPDLDMRLSKWDRERLLGASYVVNIHRFLER